MIHDLLRATGAVRLEREREHAPRRHAWITWRNTPITDAEGRLIEIVSTGIGTTDRKRADDAVPRERGASAELARDNLTGLPTRATSYQALEALIAASAGTGATFAVLFIDLDHFKRVVDARGHLNGSRAIQEVAATIRDTLEPPSWAVAYAGDEFVVVLPGSGREAALSKAEAIKAKMAETPYLVGTGRPVRLAASFGIATYPDDAQDLEGLLALGDQALFSVKRAGRGGIAAAGVRRRTAR
jgi:diguanylate cyclase (GGDEF)-like protein